MKHLFNSKGEIIEAIESNDDKVLEWLEDTTKPLTLGNIELYEREGNIIGDVESTVTVNLGTKQDIQVIIEEKWVKDTNMYNLCGW